MKTLSRLLSLVAVGTVFGLGWPNAAAWAKAPAKGPVVVELFTAQGCASCKQANRLIAKLADHPGVIALTWAVDYWDYLGWKDTFAQPVFTARQKAYARRLGPRDVYTPQVVVDGAGQVSGDDASAVDALIRAADHARRRQARVKFLGAGRIRIGPASWVHGNADVWLIRYDPREKDVEVTAGDNRGATVAHRDVVRQLARLGPWSGRAIAFKIPPAEEAGLVSVVIVQGARGGPILGAAASKSAAVKAPPAAPESPGKPTR